MQYELALEPFELKPVLVAQSELDDSGLVVEVKREKGVRRVK